MTSLMQLFLFFVNLFVGILLFFLIKLNYYFIKNEVIIVKVLITLLFALDTSLGYIILIYRLNFGIYNIYYILAIILGFIIAYNVNNRVKLLPIIHKVFDYLHHK